MPQVGGEVIQLWWWDMLGDGCCCRRVAEAKQSDLEGRARWVKSESRYVHVRVWKKPESVVRSARVEMRFLTSRRRQLPVA